MYKTNKWFTYISIRHSLLYWSEQLKKDKLYNWIKNYNIPIKKYKKVGIIMAGNIPLVGFHDFFYVL